MFNRQVVNIISSGQPHNAYAGKDKGGVPESSDTEQFWMRDFAVLVHKKLTSLTDHHVRLAPLAKSYKDNVVFVNDNRANFNFSFHSNATGISGTERTGIGVYTNKAYTAPETSQLAKVFKDHFSAFPGGSYISTLTVAELSATKDKTILFELQYHDWVGNEAVGGADWIRHAPNREAMANKFVEAFISVYGSRDVDSVTPPLAPPVAPSAPTFPLPIIGGRQAYFGPLDGPAYSVSGKYSYGEELKTWQRRAIELGVNLGPSGADGRYGYRGSYTDKAARAVQRAAGLPEDGLIGRDTWAAAWRLESV